MDQQSWRRDLENSIIPLGKCLMVPCLPQRDGNRWLDAINKNAYEIILIRNLNLNKLGILWKFKENWTAQEWCVKCRIPHPSSCTTHNTTDSEKLEDHEHSNTGFNVQWKYSLKYPNPLGQHGSNTRPHKLRHHGSVFVIWNSSRQNSHARMWMSSTTLYSQKIQSACLLKNIFYFYFIFYFCVYLCMSIHTSIWVPMEARGIRCLRADYRQCERCCQVLGLKSEPL